MRRRRFLLLLVVLLTLASRAGAHAFVTSSSLERGPLTAHQATTVTLHFNTGIELDFTRVTLLDPSGTPHNCPIRAGKRPGTVLVDLPPLAAGTYGLHYKALATDGHITEETIRFHVVATP